jgi:aspartyl protease family protein
VFVSASFVRLFLGCCFVAALAAAVPAVAPELLAGLAPRPSAYSAGPAPAGNARPPSGYRVAIPVDEEGHFLTDATIEGHAIRVVVDTGATTVALTSDTARRLGIHLAEADFSARVATANGIAAAAPVVLSEIRVGNIRVRDVAAVVIAGDGLGVNLLGMTFLSRLTRFEVGGGQLVLSE